MRGRFEPRDVALGIAAPVLAVLFAALLISVVLAGAGDPVWGTFRTVIDYGRQPRSLVLIVNSATTYYFSALAVAIGFRMNLFNIGVDGQYRLAAMTAAYVGGQFALPTGLHQVVIVLVAVLVGAAWAGVAGLLRATRGVSEVIATIMLNAIATGLVAFFLRKVAVPVAGSNNIGTRPIAASGHLGGLPLVSGTTEQVFGFLPVAVLAGIGYWLLLSRTRFGFDLRATGRSESAAVASGVDVRRMVVATMLLSGGVAGLVGMPQLLGESYSYSLDFPAGLGFTGIAIALLGRNSPIGIAIGALLWAYLDVSSIVLDIEGVSREIVVIMQGTIVLAVVVAYELVRRYRERDEQRRVARRLAAEPAAVPA